MAPLSATLSMLYTISELCSSTLASLATDAERATLAERATSASRKKGDISDIGDCAEVNSQWAHFMHFDDSVQVPYQDALMLSRIVAFPDDMTLESDVHCVGLVARYAALSPFYTLHLNGPIDVPFVTRMWSVAVH